MSKRYISKLLKIVFFFKLFAVLLQRETKVDFHDYNRICNTLIRFLLFCLLVLRQMNPLRTCLRRN